MMPAVEPAHRSGGASVDGGARLAFVRREGSGTVLTEQKVRPPLHLAKTFHENDWAVSLLTSPTAGLLEGDRILLDCRVGEGARSAVLSPAACRVHAMKSGSAFIGQSIDVGAGGCLDLWPAPLILQAEASLRQETTVHLAAEASLLLTEIITPGRVARGETFCFSSWTSRLRIHREGALCAFEQFQVRPSDGDAPDWRTALPNGSYASLHAFAPELPGGLIEALHALADGKVLRLGASPLRGNGLGIKLLAADGIILRKAILAVRLLLHERAVFRFPELLRRGQTFFY